MRWRTWYSLEEVYDSTEIMWKQLPPSGLQVLVVYFENDTRKVYSGGDWYWIFNGEIGYTPSSEWGTTQPKPDGISCLSCIKAGTGLPDAEFNKIVERARGFIIPTS